jgi:hypothetical protein
VSALNQTYFYTIYLFLHHLTEFRFFPSETVKKTLRTSALTLRPFALKKRARFTLTGCSYKKPPINAPWTISPRDLVKDQVVSTCPKGSIGIIMLTQTQGARCLRNCAN